MIIATICRSADSFSIWSSSVVEVDSIAGIYQAPFVEDIIVNTTANGYLSVNIRNEAFKSIGNETGLFNA